MTKVVDTGDKHADFITYLTRLNSLFAELATMGHGHSEAMKLNQLKAGIPHDWLTYFPTIAIKGSTTYNDITRDLADALREATKISPPTKSTAKQTSSKNEQSQSTALSIDDLRSTFKTVEDKSLQTALYSTIKNWKKDNKSNKQSRNAKHQGKRNFRDKTFRQIKTSNNRNQQPRFDPNRHTYDGVCNWCQNFGHKEEECRIKQKGGPFNHRNIRNLHRNQRGQNNGTQHSTHIATTNTTRLQLTSEQLQEFFPDGVPEGSVLVADFGTSDPHTIEFTQSSGSERFDCGVSSHYRHLADPQFRGLGMPDAGFEHDPLRTYIPCPTAARQGHGLMDDDTTTSSRRPQWNDPISRISHSCFMGFLGTYCKHLLVVFIRLLLRLLRYLTTDSSDLQAMVIHCNWTEDQHEKILLTRSQQPTHFVIDSGATASTCNRREVFTNLVPDRTPIRVANGNVCYTEGKGDIGLLKGVYYAPAFPFCLLSVPQLNSLGWAVIFDAPWCTIRKSGVEHKLGQLMGGLYRCPLTVQAIVQTRMENPLIFPDSVNVFAHAEPFSAQTVLATKPLNQNMVIHRRLAHINDEYIYCASKHNLVTSLHLPQRARFLHSFCEACALAKSKRVSSAATPGSTHNKPHLLPISTPIMPTSKSD